MTIRGLMNSTAIQQPMWAPPGVPAGGGGNAFIPDPIGGNEQDQPGDDLVDDLGGNDDFSFDGDSGFEDDQGFEDDGLNNTLGDSREITLEQSRILRDLFGSDGVTPPNQQQQTQTPEAPNQQQMTEELQAAINNFGIPEDFIPEDFNPNDPKALRQLLAKTSQRSIQMALGLMFRPVQTAMEYYQANLRAEMATQIQNSLAGNNEQRMLEEAIPIASSPEYKPVVDLLFKQSMTKAKGNVRNAIQMTRRALQAMQINVRGPSGNPRGQGRGGAGALDLYAPLPQTRNTQRPATPTQQTRDRMRTPSR